MPRPSRSELAVLAALAVVAAVHQWPLRTWFIEDAAISFAYADNLAHGHGLVAVPGGERVEGYSNFLWVAILAGFEGVGWHPFSAAKWITVFLTIVALPLSWSIAKKAIGSHYSKFALLAPLFLATNAQMAIWSASGLENALFVALLLGGIHQTLVERRRASRVPWSALLFLGLWLTRPEGILYAAIGGFWTLMFALIDRRGLGHVARWLLLFFGPAAAYHTLRYRYFAWLLPNTYYAKLGSVDPTLLDFDTRGYKQLTQWADQLMHGWLTPVYLVGLVGRREGWQARWMVGTLAAASLFFSVYADGDWMKGFRWMSLLAGTGSVLLAIGVADIARWVDQQLQASHTSTPASIVAICGVALIVPIHIKHTLAFSELPEDGPLTIKRRVDHTNAIGDRLFLSMSPEHRIVNLDMDMGAHLSWSKHEIIDLAGLVNVPIAHHDFRQYPFWRDYIYKENPPTFTHLHRHWADISRLREYDGWTGNYFELPPYDDAGSEHGGTFIRRQALMVKKPDTTPLLQTEDGFVVHEVSLFTDAIVQQGSVLVQVVVSRVKSDVPHALELDIGGTHHRLRLGHDLIGPRWWRRNEAFEGRFLLDVGWLPDPAGVTVVVKGPTGTHRETVTTLEVVSAVETTRADLMQRALDAATHGQCDLARDTTIAYWSLTPQHPRVRLEIEGLMGPVIASCLAGNAETSATPVPLLERARRWDHANADLAMVGGRIADERMAQARLAVDNHDAEAAYRLYTDVLRIDPSRAWARRYAETARDQRLGLDKDAP